jgi:hypothetical protein
MTKQAENGHQRCKVRQQCKVIDLADGGTPGISPGGERAAAEGSSQGPFGQTNRVGGQVDSGEVPREGHRQHGRPGGALPAQCVGGAAEDDSDRGDQQRRGQRRPPPGWPIDGGLMPNRFSTNAPRGLIITLRELIITLGRVMIMRRASRRIRKGSGVHAARQRHEAPGSVRGRSPSRVVLDVTDVGGGTMASTPVRHHRVHRRRLCGLDHPCGE